MIGHPRGGGDKDSISASLAEKPGEGRRNHCHAGAGKQCEDDPPERSLAQADINARTDK